MRVRGRLYDIDDGISIRECVGLPEQLELLGSTCMKGQLQKSQNSILAVCVLTRYLYSASELVHRTMEFLSYLTYHCIHQCQETYA